MAAGANITLVGLDDAELQQAIEIILARRFCRPIAVRHCWREPSPYATLFPVEIVKVVTDCGNEVHFFVKHFGDEESDHPDKQCRDREIRIYEELLQDKTLPVVKYYGSRRNEVTGRREMYLEYVDDWKLKYHDLEHWFTAAQRLAHLHAHFGGRRDELLACNFLLRFDRAYFRYWARRALDVVTRRSLELGGTLLPIVEQCGVAIDLIVSQPVTLVHNDLSAKNIIASRSSHPARICIVDWEMAGVGCGVLDLAHLKYNRLDPENDRRLCEAYCEELAGTRLLPHDRLEIERLITACDLQTTLFRLAHCDALNESDEYVAARIERAAQVWRALA